MNGWYKKIEQGPVKMLKRLSMWRWGLGLKLAISLPGLLLLGSAQAALTIDVQDPDGAPVLGIPAIK